jgi:tetratricopeptide (TPR) repeat protein
VGPGYAHLPLQLLLKGHGDAHERGRLFILLCRQAGIDAVFVARIDERVSSTPQPWAVGVLVDQDLYLFEPQLGLPIPGPGGKGIATLAQVLADPAVLKQLDVPGGPAYPLGPEQLKNLVALIEAEPDSLARRFDLLEQAMPSSRRLVLASHPSQLEPRLRKSKGIGSVSLWRVPFEALHYQIGRHQLIASDFEKQVQFQQEESIFMAPETPLMLGRNNHLQGLFETRDTLPGARKLYMQARTPDAVRESVYISDEFRKRMGFQQPLPDDEQQKRLLLETYDTMMLRAKQHASYWMGLVHYEAGNYDAAIEWLDERTIQSPLPSPWLAGARYNLARSYEALGQYDKAIAWLRADADSPQRHGNLLRATWLEQRK